MKKLENLYVNFSGQEILNTAQVLTTQTISGDSPAVDEFERSIAERFNKKRAVAVCSGTVSIYCALHSLNIGHGDEVILNPTSVIMSALPAIQLGAKVRFADNNLGGFGFDINSLKASISTKTKAIITVPMWGYPIPMDDLLEISATHKVPLIEDISQSHGTTWNGSLLGTLGLIGCLSTQERKLITTGEGGAVLTDDITLANKIYTLKRYGLEVNGEIGISRGLNFKMSAISAAAGITQIKKLDDKISRRRKVGLSIKEGINANKWFEEIKYPSHSRQNYYALAFQITDATVSSKKLGDYLSKKGIISDPWRYDYKALYEYPLFKDGKGSFPNAEKLINSAFTLPCHEGMDEEDIERVINAINTF